jgi:prepilin-type N-terminal cleavage/methylation domain-containing protein
MRSSQKGFTMIEMVLVIVAVGIIGSMAADMLFLGSDIFVKETNRQGFVSEARSAFWRLMRDTQGQSSPADFILSDQNSLYVKNGKGDLKDFQTGSSGYFNFRMGTGSYNSLSSSLGYSQSNGFTFYDNSFNVVSPSSGGLTEAQAKTVHLSKLDLTFVNDTDTLSLSSFVYPHNFRFGSKMSYHD